MSSLSSLFSRKRSSIIYVLIIFLLIPSSGFIQKKEIVIYLIGDSTVANKPYQDGNPEKGWGQVFPLYFKEGIRIDNHAVNGRSTKSFRDEGRWNEVMEDLVPGDYVIIEFGHNDQKSHDSTRYAPAETAYRDNLIKFIEETRSKKAIPVLATPIVRRRFDENGQFYDTHGLYPKVVREVAKEKQVPLLDLHMLTKELLMQYGEERSKILFLHIPHGEYDMLPEGKNDDTHLSAIGAFRICDLVIAEIKKNIPTLAPFIRE